MDNDIIPYASVVVYTINRYTISRKYRYKLVICEMKYITNDQYVARRRCTSYGHKSINRLHKLAVRWYKDAVYYPQLKPGYYYSVKMLKMMGVKQQLKTVRMDG